MGTIEFARYYLFSMISAVKEATTKDLNLNLTRLKTLKNTHLTIHWWE